MTYYVGKNLKNRVNDFGLTDLYNLITEYSQGKTPWPGPYQITPSTPEQLEPIRVAVYSILHETATKPLFRVKMYLGTLLIELRSQGAGRAATSILTGGQQVPLGRPGDAEIDDMSGVFNTEELD